MESTSQLEAVLESVEALPADDQEILVDLIRKRLSERRRSEILANIAESRAEYRTGRVRRGTADELMAEIAD
jgi:hypothetical protein